MIYTPEKIQEFENSASQLLTKSVEIFKVLINKLDFISMGDLQDANLTTLHSQCKQLRDKLQKEHEKYFDIVDMYEYTDPVISKLDKIVGDLDTLQMEVSDLESVFDSLLEAQKYLSRIKTTIQKF